MVRLPLFWSNDYLPCLRGLLGFVVFSIALVIAPADEPVDPEGTIDWVGVYLGVAALVLFNFVWV